MKMAYILIEELHAGLAEHAFPIVARLLQSGRADVTMACLPQERDTLECLYAPLAGRSRHLQLQSVNEVDWTRPPDAMLSTIPGSPGPLFRDVRSPVHIPRVAMPHGLTDKYNKFPAHFIGHPLGYFNVLFASGEAMYQGSWEQYEKKHPYVRAALKCLPIGVPRTDRLFAEQHRRAEILESLGLDPMKKTVLYGPTYHREASLEQWGESILEQLASLDVNVLVRLHHLSTNRASRAAQHLGHQGKDWLQWLRRFAGRYPAVRAVEGDSNPWYIAADLMVGDVSGACYEFIVQNKPVVFVDVPDFFRCQGRDGIAYWGRRAGIVTPADAVAYTVAEALSGTDRKRTEREALIRQLIYHPGHASERAVEVLFALIDGTLDYPQWGPVMNQRYDGMLEAYIIQRLSGLRNNASRFALYGNGAHTERLLALMARAREQGTLFPELVCIYDDEAAPGAKRNGIPVICPESPGEPRVDTVVLSTDYFQEALRRRCAEIWGGGMPVIDLYEAFPWHKPDSLRI